jgi:hypothetical protein
MNFLSGLIKINIGDSFNPDVGIKVLKQALEHSRQAQLYDLPGKLLDELRPCLPSHNLQIFLPDTTKKPDWLKIGVEPLPCRIKTTYHGNNMYLGGIKLAHQSFDVVWSRSRIYEINRVRLDKCIRCSLRHKLHSLEPHHKPRLGSVISRETFDDFIHTELECAEEGIIANLPFQLLRKFLPKIKAQNFRLLLPNGTGNSPELVVGGGVRILPGLVKIHSEVNGQRVNCGGICLPHMHLGIGWDNEDMISLRTFEWPECVNCLKHTYDTAWHLSRRIW